MSKEIVLQVLPDTLAAIGPGYKDGLPKPSQSGTGVYRNMETPHPGCHQTGSWHPLPEIFPGLFTQKG